MLIWHSELTNMQRRSQSKSFDVEMGDYLEDMIHDLGQESFQQAHAPMYDTLQTVSRKPLYSGCNNSLTLFSTVLSLVNVKVRYGWSDKSFSSLLQVMHYMLPKENTLPKSYFQTKKILARWVWSNKRFLLALHIVQTWVWRNAQIPPSECSSDEISKKGPKWRCCGIFWSFQGLSVYLLMETTQKTLHGMQMEETATKCFVILVIPPSGRRLIICIWILAKRQEILGSNLPLMEWIHMAV